MHFHAYGPSTTFVKGNGALKRNISVQGIYNNIGQKRISALLGFHAITGCDVSNSYVGRAKDWCFKTFMGWDDEILDSLSMLGSVINVLFSVTHI